MELLRGGEFPKGTVYLSVPQPLPRLCVQAVSEPITTRYGVSYVSTSDEAATAELGIVLLEQTIGCLLSN